MYQLPFTGWESVDVVTELSAAYNLVFLLFLDKYPNDEFCSSGSKVRLCIAWCVFWCVDCYLCQCSERLSVWLRFLTVETQ